MIKKLGILLVVVLFSFSFAAENNNVLDAQDKAEVKKIKQQIKQEKDIALKKEKEEQKQEQLNANQVDIENMVEINILLEKIAKIETSLKDNILLKRYSNYLSYG
ncbi:mechanosensitive ion channel family protein, partial [Aliarcobacter butzleri]